MRIKPSSHRVRRIHIWLLYAAYYLTCVDGMCAKAPENQALGVNAHYF